MTGLQFIAVIVGPPLLIGIIVALYYLFDSMAQGVWKQDRTKPRKAKAELGVSESQPATVETYFVPEARKLSDEQLAQFEYWLDAHRRAVGQLNWTFKTDLMKHLKEVVRSDDVTGEVSLSGFTDLATFAGNYNPSDVGSDFFTASLNLPIPFRSWDVPRMGIVRIANALFPVSPKGEIMFDAKTLSDHTHATQEVHLKLLTQAKEKKEIYEDLFKKKDFDKRFPTFWKVIYGSYLLDTTEGRFLSACKQLQELPPIHQKKIFKQMLNDAPSFDALGSEPFIAYAREYLIKRGWAQQLDAIEKKQQEIITEGKETDYLYDCLILEGIKRGGK